jgi:Cu/Ag efflux protein CusF
MPKSMLIAAALVAGAVGLNQTMAQQTQNQGAAEEMKVTGVVTKADEQTGAITIGDKTLVMEPGEGMYPRVGSKVTALYEDRNGKNVITRIGQAQQ